MAKQQKKFENIFAPILFTTNCIMPVKETIKIECLPHLSIKNIQLSPTLLAFVSENVLNILVEKFNISPITTPTDDLNEILSK